MHSFQGFFVRLFLKQGLVSRNLSLTNFCNLVWPVTHEVVQANLHLTEILLSLPSEC